jgi:hypothetical protein
VKWTRGQSRFVLKECLQRQRVAHPNDSTANDVPINELPGDAEIDEEDFALMEGDRVIPAVETVPSTVPKIRAQFGRRRTHNEQVIVAPCGIIITNEKFYGAEAVSSVVVGRQLILR